MNIWTFLGDHDREARPSNLALAFALIFAGQTFIAPAGAYPVYMSVLAFLASTFLLYRGFRAHSYLGLLFVPLALPWLNPLLGGDWFDSIGWQFFMAHSLLAMAFAVAAFGYMRLEGTKQKKRGG